MEVYILDKSDAHTDENGFLENNREIQDSTATKDCSLIISNEKIVSNIKLAEDGIQLNSDVQSCDEDLIKNDQTKNGDAQSIIEYLVKDNQMRRSNIAQMAQTYDHIQVNGDVQSCTADLIKHDQLGKDGSSATTDNKQMLSDELVDTDHKIQDRIPINADIQLEAKDLLDNTTSTANPDSSSTILSELRTVNSHTQISKDDVSELTETVYDSSATTDNKQMMPDELVDTDHKIQDGIPINGDIQLDAKDLLLNTTSAATPDSSPTSLSKLLTVSDNIQIPKDDVSELTESDDGSICDEDIVQIPADIDDTNETKYAVTDTDDDELDSVPQKHDNVDASDMVPSNAWIKSYDMDTLKTLIDDHDIINPINKHIQADGGFWPPLPSHTIRATEKQCLTLFARPQKPYLARIAYKRGVNVQIVTTSLNQVRVHSVANDSAMVELPSFNGQSVVINLTKFDEISKARYRCSTYMQAVVPDKKSAPKRKSDRDAGSMATTPSEIRMVTVNVLGVQNNVRLIYDDINGRFLYQALDDIRAGDEITCDYGVSLGSRTLDVTKKYKSTNKQQKMTRCNSIPLRFYLMDANILRDYRSTVNLTCHTHINGESGQPRISWEVDRTNWTVRACLMILFFTNNQFWVSSGQFSLITGTKTSIINAMLRKFMHETVILVKRHNAKDGNVPSSHWKLARNPGEVCTCNTVQRILMFREYQSRLDKTIPIKVVEKVDIKRGNKRKRSEK